MAQRTAVARLIRGYREARSMTVVAAAEHSKQFDPNPKKKGVSRQKWTEIESAKPTSPRMLSLAARTIEAPLVEVLAAAGYNDAAEAASTWVSSSDVDELRRRLRRLGQVLNYLLDLAEKSGVHVPPELFVDVEEPS